MKHRTRRCRRGNEARGGGGGGGSKTVMIPFSHPSLPTRAPIPKLVERENLFQDATEQYKAQYRYSTLPLPRT